MEICFDAGYRGGSPWPAMEKKQKPANGTTDFKLDVPDLPDCSKRLKDIEDSEC